MKKRKRKPKPKPPALVLTHIRYLKLPDPGERIRRRILKKAGLLCD